VRAALNTYKLSIKGGATGSLHLFALPSGHALAAHQRCRTPEHPEPFKTVMSLQYNACLISLSIQPVSPRLAFRSTGPPVHLISQLISQGRGKGTGMHAQLRACTARTYISFDSATTYT